MDEKQSRIEIAALSAKVMRLQVRLDEDRKFAEQKLQLSLELAKGVDVAALEEQIAQLKAALEDESAVVDKLVIFITRDLRTP